MASELTQESAALLSAPATILRAVTPADNTPLPNGPCKAFQVGVAGNVAVIAEDDTAAVTLVGLQAGQVVPLRVKVVMATNTTATNITAFY